MSGIKRPRRLGRGGRGKPDGAEAKNVRAKMSIAIPYNTPDGMLVAMVELSGPRRWMVPPSFTQLGVQWWKLRADALKWDGRVLTRYRYGYQFNGGSIPWWARWYEKPDGHLFGYLPHDWGFQYHYIEAWNPVLARWERVKISKAHADHELLEDLELSGIRITKGWTITAAVAVGGWPAWWFGTCNGKHSVCPANAADWCPMQNRIPPCSAAKRYEDFVSRYCS